MAASNETERRERLKSLLASREPATKPKGIHYDNEHLDDEADAPAAQATGQGAGPRLGQRPGQGGAGLGGAGLGGGDLGTRLRARLAQGGGGGGQGPLGAGLGGGAASGLSGDLKSRLRERLAQGGAAGGLGGAGAGGDLGARLRARLAQGGGGGGQGPLGAAGGLLGQRPGQGGSGQGDRPYLRQILTERLRDSQQGNADAAGAGPDAVLDEDAETTRVFLRERIEKLQARLAELDRHDGEVEDAVILDESAGPAAKA